MTLAHFNARRPFGRGCLLGLAMLTATAVAEVPPTADLPAIFNGTDLSGWKVVGEPYWKVVAGTIVGENAQGASRRGRRWLTRGSV